MSNLAIYLLIVFAAIIVSRIVSKQALKQLSPEERSRLLASFSSYRLYNRVIFLGLVGAYFAATTYIPQSYPTVTLLFIILCFAVLGTVSVLSYRKLKSLNLPHSYIRSFLIGLGVKYAGLAAASLPLVLRVVETKR